MTSYQKVVSDWERPVRPAALTEERLIEAFLEGHFAINSHLPPERALAEQLGVTRPTLREALQRLARDGWIEIRQGRPTRVRDFWREGTMGVLSAIARSQKLPEEFVPNLLELRFLLAPTYTRAAMEHEPDRVADHIGEFAYIPDTVEAFASADWEVHSILTGTSGNPIFTFILNDFHEIYRRMAVTYFAYANLRAHSRAFYAAISSAAKRRDAVAVERITSTVMKESLAYWRQYVIQGDS